MKKGKAEVLTNPLAFESATDAAVLGGIGRRGMRDCLDGGSSAVKMQRRCRKYRYMEEKKNKTYYATKRVVLKNSKREVK